jgi:hypothetical protein
VSQSASTLAGRPDAGKPLSDRPALSRVAFSLDFRKTISERFPAALLPAVGKEESAEGFWRRERIAIFNGHAPNCSCIFPASGGRQRGLGATNWDLGTRGLDLCNGVGASFCLLR